MNTVARASIVAAVIALSATGAIAFKIFSSPYITEQYVAIDQPVPFSHAHHVAGLGIDCRYCHTSVEESSFAGIPPTHTCMSCHSQIWINSNMLAPVRNSFIENKPLQWNRVHKLADYVYFNHSIHVAKGVGCTTCHGPVDQMPLMWQNATLYMEWCLNCHRNPEKYLRPKDKVFDMGYSVPQNQEEMGAKLVAEYHVQKKQLDNCGVCHR